MALVSKSFEIPSCDDAELNLKRTSKLEYRISFDDSKENKAVVFMVGGYGANANIAFLDFSREFIAKKFNVVAVQVFYHCFAHRRSNDAKYNAATIFTEEDLPSLIQVLSEFGIETKEVNTHNAFTHYDLLNSHLASLKAQGKIASNFKAKLSATFFPPNEEYQNFGLMAAIDHINALKHLVKTYPEFASLPKLTGGGSYGGYLALLIAKIAPWYVDGVIDNSGTALPLLECFLARDLNKCEYVFDDPNILVEMFLKTHWTANAASPYFFSKAHYKIRSLLNGTHLNLQARANPNTIFVSYHSAKDPFGTARDKEILFSALKELGFDARLNLIENESQVDGKFIKDLGHGMRMGDRALFRKELPTMLEKLQGRKAVMSENSISYPCEDKIFIFGDKGDKFELELL